MNKELDLSVSCYGAVKDLRYDVAILPWGATEPQITICLTSLIALLQE